MFSISSCKKNLSFYLLKPFLESFKHPSLNIKTVKGKNNPTGSANNATRILSRALVLTQKSERSRGPRTEFCSALKLMTVADETLAYYLLTNVDVGSFIIVVSCRVMMCGCTTYLPCLPPLYFNNAIPYHEPSSSHGKQRRV